MLKIPDTCLTRLWSKRKSEQLPPAFHRAKRRASFANQNTLNLMLLDDFLPKFDVRTHHAIRVAAPPEHVYACLWSTNFDHWGITRALYALRTLPTFFSSPM